MSTKLADQLVDAVVEQDALASLVEAHLDAHPLAVDEAEVARVAARVEARIRPARRSLAPWAVGGLALAATVLLSSAYALRTPETVVVSKAPLVILRADVDRSPGKVQLVEEAGRVDFPEARRSVHVPAQTQVLTAEQGRAAVLLVQEGAARTEGVDVPEHHWAALTRDAKGEAVTVVFPDGERPPPELEQGVWAETTVEEQLKELRWQAMPEATLKTLDHLLEKP